MSAPIKQHLIDPEICIRCYTCENTCPIQAITHNDDNVVVDAEQCNFCMDCIPVCPTGSIDEWRVVATPYTLEEQFEFEELPEQADIEIQGDNEDTTIEALDSTVAALLAEAHAGAGGMSCAPASASKPSVNLFMPSRPAEATVVGNFRLTAQADDSDVRHVILDLGNVPFPVLEGQSVGIIPPGTDGQGRAHHPRLYSVSSPRDGERSNFNNLSLTVKRETNGVCSNYVCDLATGDRVQLAGPFGSTFLMPTDPQARLLMICTGTGSAPFRAFTMYRQRTQAEATHGSMSLFFGARTPESLPYFGPLAKVPEPLLRKHLVFSRLPNQEKRYVQDELLTQREHVAELLNDDATHVYLCGLRAMETGVLEALSVIAESIGTSWVELRDRLREQGRFHVETY